MSNPFIPIIVMLAVALAIAIGGLIISAFLGPKKKNAIKTANYECGIDPVPGAGGATRFPVKYYLVAMTFIVFDIEVVFLYPWAVSFGIVGAFGMVAMFIFLGLITVPFVLEWRRGGLDWD